MEPDIDNDDEIKSKSQRKREMESLQDMGKELVDLSKERLMKMDLPDDLLSAVLEAKRITAHGATRRQMQYIGKIMRGVDADAIAEQLAEIRGESNAAKAEFHALERWRERLIADDGAVTEWLGRHPGTDAQKLRQLIRNARKEAELGKPPKSSRELFRMLREDQAARSHP
jgi:ribosome-associated protein